MRIWVSLFGAGFSRSICFSLTLAFVLLPATNGHAAETTLVSLSSAGVKGNRESHDPSISTDGRYVAFTSDASNLVPGDTNGRADIFVRDRLTNTTTRVSVSSAGVQGNDLSCYPSISADGRYVAFDSESSNLVPGDTNNSQDVFVRDRQAGTTTRVSVSTAGVQGKGSGNPSISADGRYVAFSSYASNLVTGDTNGQSDVFVRDRQTGTTSRVSRSSAGVQGNDWSFIPSISADGRYVAFTSDASNLVPGDTNNTPDIFVRDRQTGTTSRVSRSSAGVQGNDRSIALSISADGRYVAFDSIASNLVPGDTNNSWDVFVRDRQAGTTTRVSVSTAGVQGKGSENPSISADGRYVAFTSDASNLVPGDTNNKNDVFVRDRLANTTTRVSVSSAGVQGNKTSLRSSISADGRYVAFDSYSVIMPGDTNSVQQGHREIVAAVAPQSGPTGSTWRFIRLRTTLSRGIPTTPMTSLFATDKVTPWDIDGDVFVRDLLINKSTYADIRTSVYSKPASVTKGATAYYVFVVSNIGPSSASSVSLIDVISKGTAISLTPSQGTCSKAAVSVCRFGTLAPWASAWVAVKIRADANPLTQLLSASAAEFDSAPANNRGTVTTPVTP